MNRLDGIRAEAHFVAARHAMPTADYDLAVDFASRITSTPAERSDFDRLLLADTLIEIAQLGLQLKEEDLVMRAIVRARDIAENVDYREAFAYGWTPGYTDMVRAKAMLVSDIFADEPDEDTQIRYRAAVTRKHDELTAQLGSHQQVTYPGEISEIIGQRTEIATINMLNHVNRAAKVKAFAVHTGIILDRCDVHVMQDGDEKRLASDIELINFVGLSIRREQPFIQVKRNAADSLSSRQYADHIVPFVPGQELGNQTSDSVERHGFIKLPKTIREQIRRRIYPFMEKALQHGTQKRHDGRITYNSALHFPSIVG